MKNVFILFAFFIATTLFGQNALLKNELLVAYDFETTEAYAEAKKALAPVLKKNGLNYNDRVFVKNYLRFYDFLISGSEDFATLKSCIAEIESLKKRTWYQSELLINLYSSRYHYIAYNKTWEESLEYARKGYESADFKNAKAETKTDYFYDLGYLYDKVGNSFEGIRFYKKSLDLYIKKYGENSTHVALNYNNLAFAYANVYDQRNTIAYYNKAAAIWEKVHKTEPDIMNYLVTSYQNLVYQYLKYGDIPKAKSAANQLNFHYLKKYANKKTTNSNIQTKATLNYALTNLRVLLAQEKADEAEAFAKIMENCISQADKNPQWIIYNLQSYQELGEFYETQKNETKAVAFFLKGKSLAEKNGANFNAAKFNLKLAQIATNKRQFAEAENYLRNAAKNNDSKKFELLTYQIPLQDVKIQLAKKENANARIQLKKLLSDLNFSLNGKKHNFDNLSFSDVDDLVDPVFMNFFAECGNSFFELYKNSNGKSDLSNAERLLRISAKLFKTYYLRGEYNAYLQETHEKISSGLLRIAALPHKNASKKTELLNLVEQNASVHLLENYRQKTEKYVLEKSEQSVKSLQNELLFYESQYKKKKTQNSSGLEKIAQLKASLETRKKAYTVAQQEFNNLNSKLFTIADVQVKVQANQQIFKFYCAGNSVFRVSISKKQIAIHELGSVALIEKLTNRVVTGIKQRDYSKTDADKLSKLLLPSVVAQNITIIPDGFLNYLPFEILKDSKTTSLLIDRASVSYAYSLPMWLLTSGQSINKSSNLLAVAPDYSLGATSESRSELKKLPFAEKESAAVASLFDGKQISGLQATKSAFLEELNRHSIFHLAMHAQVVEDAFEQSCLYFQDNQKLYFSDLYQLNFPAKLVVLSACETGTGSIKSGEGVMSLSRALTYAGVQSAVVSLWQVPDKETSEIMIAFYQYLNQGKNKSEALAMAKRDFLKNNPMKSNPYYWAGFIVSGADSPVVRKAEYWQFFVFGIGVILLYFIGNRAFRSRSVD
ncbi:CHAT domain-containing tetratricopeptide repeat protein [Flavobacterium sp.]|uniref:CHAT domain-containing protein n=1 Tax=Flavobacterium sp. TaxID=239 RepID=UPI00261D69C3|nr:CHAT domain-containing tetratricopeptide repeat protein [Flavobacterium sp.]